MVNLLGNTYSIDTIKRIAFSRYFFFIRATLWWVAAVTGRSSLSRKSRGRTNSRLLAPHYNGVILCRVLLLTVTATGNAIKR